MIRYRLLFILCFVFIMTGCVSFEPKVASISPSELKTSRNITLIPYKASPILISVTSFEHEASGVFGPLGIQTYRAATAEERGKIADYLSKSAGSWNPSLALAEECLTILKNNSRVSIINSSISNLGTLPGSEVLHKKEPRTFTERYDAAWSRDWSDIRYDVFDTNNSLIKYRKEHPEIKADWFLEVFNYGIGLNDNEIGFTLYMKLMDTNTNDKIASSYVGDTYPIPAIPNGFDAFNQTWRTVSQKACTKALSDMGLIAK